MAKAAATAASTAFPPALRMSKPAWEARGWAEATIPWTAPISAFFIPGSGTGGTIFGAHDGRRRNTTRRMRKDRLFMASPWHIERRYHGEQLILKIILAAPRVLAGL
jgi:hypothetical protein